METAVSTTPAVILAGGDPIEPELAAGLPEPAFLVAADSGLHQAAALGLAVDLVVGDLDSADPDAVAAARNAGATVETHPADKDATDLELALQRVAASGFTRAIVLGGAGGRVDHFLANAQLLAAPAWSALTIEWWIGTARIHVVRRRVRLSGRPGDLVSLLPVGGPARAVTTTGLAWPLAGEDLTPGPTRGVSNRLTDAAATVALEGGVLFVIHDPGGPR